MNYYAPLFISIMIHLGIIISFSNLLNINFDQFFIESRKPVAAYLVFEKPSIKKNKIPVLEKSRETPYTSKKEEKIQISSAAIALKQFDQVKQDQIYEDTELKEDQFQSELEKFSLLIKKQVMENWKRPKNNNFDLKTEIKIGLVPTGEILSVTLLKGSGNKAFDESAMMAISKVKSFEGLNMQMRLFDKHFREFILIFSPE